MALAVMRVYLNLVWNFGSTWLSGLAKETIKVDPMVKTKVAGI